MPLQEVERLLPEIGPGLDPVTIHSRCRRGSDTVELANRQVLNEFCAHPRRDDEQPIRLAMVRGELGQKFVVGTPAWATRRPGVRNHQKGSARRAGLFPDAML